MNILVTGANGQLGNCMRNVASQGAHRYIFSDVNEVEGFPTVFLDITSMEAVREIVAAENIGAIINCAAYTNVDGAEDAPQICDLLNHKAVENLAVAMKEVGGMLVHISTDYVFGGDPYNIPCKEDQKGTPTGVYGLTKLRGEEAVKRVGCEHLIIRTAWLYSEYGKNFVKTMLNLTSAESVAARIAAGRPAWLNVVFDQTGTPTYAQDLADTIFHILESGKYIGNSGIYHYSNEGVCSWYDFTKMITQLARQTECEVKPCHSNEFPSKVVRPSYSVLDKTKIKATFGIEVPYWVDSLNVCIKNLKNQ